MKPLVFMTSAAPKIYDALIRYDAMDNTQSLRGHEIFILAGDPIKYQVQLWGGGGDILCYIHYSIGRNNNSS